MHDVERLGAPSSVGKERGKIEDRPWAARLAALARAGYTGQITLRVQGQGAQKTHAIAFANGRVVGASSPVPADAVARIAVAMRLAPAALAAPPTRDRRGAGDHELDAFVAVAELAPEQVQRLKHRVLVQRAARTFAIDKGEYALEPKITIPVILGVEVDVRAVVYEGVRLHLDSARLVTALAPLGTWFALTADPELARYEFSDAEAPVLAALRDGTSAPELEARHRDLDPRLVQAVIYALAVHGALARMSTPARGTRRTPPTGTPVVTEPPRALGSTAIAPVTRPHVPTLFEPVAPPPGTRAPTDSGAVPMLIRLDPEISVARAARPDVPAAPIVPAIPRKVVRRALEKLVVPPARRAHTEPFLEQRPTTLRPNALSASELRALIAERSTAAGAGADHFALLGVPVGASIEAVRAAYIELARNLRNERLVELQIHDQEFRARSLFAQIGIAYTALTDPARRAEYVSGLQRSGAPSARELDFELLAAQAFERGARALRADDPELAVAELRTACALAPEDIRYLATLGHAEFCASKKS